MLNLSKKSDYGLLLLKLLVQEPKSEYVSLSTLSRKHKLPYKFLTQIARELTTAFILESKEGVHGGYRLAQDPRFISVAQVVSVLEGNREDVCEQEAECACRGVCVHEGVMSRVLQGIADYSLAELFEGKHL